MVTALGGQLLVNQAIRRNTFMFCYGLLWSVPWRIQLLPSSRFVERARWCTQWASFFDRLNVTVHNASDLHFMTNLIQALSSMGDRLVQHDHSQVFYNFISPSGINHSITRERTNQMALIQKVFFQSLGYLWLLHHSSFSKSDSRSSPFSYRKMRLSSKILRFFSSNFRFLTTENISKSIPHMVEVLDQSRISAQMLNILCDLQAVQFQVTFMCKSNVR